MNLLGGRGFIGACSSESEGLQQPIKVGQTSDVDRRRTEVHCRANGRIKHPSGEDDRHTRFSLDNDDLSSRSPFGIELSDPAAVQRVPAVVDLYLLVDMGRMAPQWLWAEKLGYSVDRTAADSAPRRCTVLS
jgi:hypothetical protein